jgi:hypothetical protein
MVHAPTAPIEGLCIAPIQLPHPAQKVRGRGFDQQMMVVVHQAVRMAASAKPIDHARQERQEGRAVPGIRDDVLPRIAPAGHMIDGTGARKRS